MLSTSQYWHRGLVQISGMRRKRQVMLRMLMCASLQLGTMEMLRQVNLRRCDRCISCASVPLSCELYTGAELALRFPPEILARTKD